MNLKNNIQLVTNMGMRYTSYRIRHELEKRSGILRKRHPMNPSTKSFISLEDFRKQKSGFVIQERETLQFANSIEDISSLSSKAEKVLHHQTLFFSSEWKDLGAAYDWITNPDTGYRYDISKHWSDIPDMSAEAGDIKFVWEKSRFSWLLTLIRYDFHFNKDHSEFVFSQIEDWIDKNPINQGPNWRCSQETSLRIFNWCFALNFYKNADALTEDRWQKIQNILYWSLHHVYHHIDFSRIAVRNNHAITETLFLALSHMLFPFIPETEQWAADGRKWFEEEIDYQIYEDGTFLQFSMNYHRVVIQLLSLGIAVSEIHKKPFSGMVYDKAHKSLNFLYQCLQEENGWLPNYGANDGALFFPLSDTEYRDYRPQLNTLHFILSGTHLYEDSFIEEDSQWIAEQIPRQQNYMPALKKEMGTVSFPVGGYYIIREKKSFTMIRCGKHKDRPSQADNLHMDIWVKGENILRDSGTYKYNTTKELLDYFMGTASHNTVVVNGMSQMLKGSRFIWYHWSQCKKADFKETDTEYIFEGEISAFRHLNPQATHFRRVVKKKNEPVWIVYDRIENLDEFPKKQIWHTDNSQVHINSKNNEKQSAETSYNSSYYGIITDGKGVGLHFEKEILTEITAK